jgi:hypothetical protein
MHRRQLVDSHGVDDGRRQCHGDEHGAGDSLRHRGIATEGEGRGTARGSGHAILIPHLIDSLKKRSSHRMLLRATAQGIQQNLTTSIVETHNRVVTQVGGSDASGSIDGDNVARPMDIAKLGCRLTERRRSWLQAAGR